MHLVSGNTGVPVYIGEFNAWIRVNDWDVTAGLADGKCLPVKSLAGCHISAEAQKKASLF